MAVKRIKRPKPSAPIFRLLDANLNRCREGLRVLEDTSRFICRDPGFFGEFRSARHRLDILTRRLVPDLVGSRNSSSDRGRTMREPGRKNMKSLVAANFRRCQESLRVLEEYGKLFSSGAGREFKKIRFEIYDIEKRFSGKI